MIERKKREKIYMCVSKRSKIYGVKRCFEQPDHIVTIAREKTTSTTSLEGQG